MVSTLGKDFDNEHIKVMLESLQYLEKNDKTISDIMALPTKYAIKKALYKQIKISAKRMRTKAEKIIDDRYKL